MLPAYLLSFFTGFLSLSLEILWIRLYSFANISLPQAFAFVLTMYLIGIALGAVIGKRFCAQNNNLWQVSGLVLLVSGFSDFMSPWIYASLSHSTGQVIFGGILILLTALFKAIEFPIAHHLGSSQRKGSVGKSVSRVYVANILGATLGPIITGVLFLSAFTAQQGFIICSGLTCLLASFCFMQVARPRWIAACLIVSISLLSFSYLLDRNYLISIIAATPTEELRRIVENQHGIVTTYRGGRAGDKILGGNIYDGTTNLDPIINSNGINRVLVLSTLNDKPTRVLMIGLSIGTWLKLVTAFPGVEYIDVIEINPGYLEAINDYPAQKSALLDPRVHLYLDDGRRWLKAHPDNMYDLIIMNTTFHWRAYAGNLLSYEFLSLLKKHMAANAVLIYNTTSSPDAFKTAHVVFNHAYLYENFVINADFDWRDRLKSEMAAQKLSDLMLDGKPLFPKGSEAVILDFLDRVPISLESFEAGFTDRQLEIITDKNLITEYKYGRQ